jgi:hypothetical protein
MKNYCWSFYRPIVGFLVTGTFLLYSCGQKSVPRNMTGLWMSDKIQVTVRIQDERRNFKFVSDSVIITLVVNNDFTAAGSIGSAKFENCKISTNWLLPVKMSGIAFTIECGTIGKIFENDPLDSKEVELWLGPLNDSIDSELRYTQGASHFPMAGFILTKEIIQ